MRHKGVAAKMCAKRLERMVNNPGCKAVKNTLQLTFHACDQIAKTIRQQYSDKDWGRSERKDHQGTASTTKIVGGVYV
jgi:hypothetical protein